MPGAAAATRKAGSGAARTARGGGGGVGAAATHPGWALFRGCAEPVAGLSGEKARAGVLSCLPEAYRLRSSPSGGIRYAPCLEEEGAGEGRPDAGRRGSPGRGTASQPVSQSVGAAAEEAIWRPSSGGGADSPPATQTAPATASEAPSPSCVPVTQSLPPQASPCRRVC